MKTPVLHVIVVLSPRRLGTLDNSSVRSFSHFPIHKGLFIPHHIHHKPEHH